MADIISLLGNKSATEKAQIKSSEIAKLNHVGEYENAEYGVRVEIQSLKAIEINGSHGIEIMARAWKDGKQLGLGPNGTTDLERFRIFNPPILVPDGTFTEKTFEGVSFQVPNYKEDLVEAIRQCLAHTITVSSKEGEVVPGSIGNTTSTFFPNAGIDGSNTTYDSWYRRVVANDTWTDLVTGAGTATDTGTDTNLYAGYQTGAISGYHQIYRAHMGFNTGPTIPAGDAISSAVHSLWGVSILTENGQTFGINIFQSSPVSNVHPTDADYAAMGTTAYGTTINVGSLATGAYNNITYTATGIAAIAKGSGITNTSVREANFDVPNSAPTITGLAKFDFFNFASADTAVTTNDPKLVVVHAAPVNAKFFPFLDRR